MATDGWVYAAGMSIQHLPQSPTVAAILDEVRHQGISGYRLAKDAGVTLHTVQRFLAGEGSPTIHTVETIAAALGLRIAVEPTQSPQA